MNSHRFRPARALAATALALAALGLQAQPSPTVPAPATPASPAAPGMDFQQLVARLAALGYRDISEVERKSDKLYEVEARNDKGQRVELNVDARSGEVLALEVKRGH